MDPLTVLLVLAVLAAAMWERRQNLRAVSDERAAWRAERSQLLERIQRPDRPPPNPDVPPRHMTEDERARIEAATKQREQLARVGTVQPLRSDGNGA